MVSLLHIASRVVVDAAKKVGVYRPSSFDQEGFIHCSYANQVCRVANTRFRGQSDLVLIEIDKNQLNCEVIDEDLYDAGEQFPHIYGELRWSAVVHIHEFPCDDTGRFSLPASIYLQTDNGRFRIR